VTCDIANEFAIRCRPIKVLKIYSIHLFIIQVYIPVVRNLTGVVQVRLFAGVYYASPVSLIVALFCIAVGDDSSKSIGFRTSTPRR